MPFITFEQYKSAYPQQGLITSSEDFAGISDQIDTYIATKANISIPNTSSEAPAWTHAPALWLAYRFIALQQSSLSPEIAAESRTMFDEAKAVIEEHITVESRKLSGSYGHIEEAFTW